MNKTIYPAIQWYKRIQLGLIHLAVASTLVPINSTLNRVMIQDLGLWATLVAVLASLPYLFSPIQVAIGTFSDRYPIWGKHRSPYILLGLFLCATGLALSPYAAFALKEQFSIGILLSMLSFGAWGMGFNLATVSYFSLASELSGTNGRSKTISIMFFIMILGIIITSITLSKLLENYTETTLIRSFSFVAIAAFSIGLLGLFKLEPKRTHSVTTEDSSSWATHLQTIRSSSQTKRFFLYLVLLLAAILGQDILLEPYAAHTFHLPIDQTTRITSIWGVCFLISLGIAGALGDRISKRKTANIGSWSGIFSFALIIISGLLSNLSLFYIGVLLLGVATGLATVSNLSLMLDMILPEQVGLFMGAWGMASAVARLTGNLLSGILLDSFSFLTGNFTYAYIAVFLLEITMLGYSLFLLKSIDISLFHQQTRSTIELAAMADE